MNDLVELNWNNLERVVTTLIGVEDWNYGTIHHVNFRGMYGRGRMSGVEISIQDVNPYKKIFRRVFLNESKQISTGRLLLVYRELKNIYDSTIASKVNIQEELEARVKSYNDFARSLKDVSVRVWSYPSYEGDYDLTFRGSEELVKILLHFLERECGRKSKEEDDDD